MNNEIIPALNKTLREERIKTIDLSQKIKHQEEIQYELGKLLQNAEQIYMQIDRLDTLQNTIHLLSSRIEEIARMSDELRTAARMNESAEGSTGPLNCLYVLSSSEMKFRDCLMSFMLSLKEWGGHQLVQTRLIHSLALP